MAYSKYGLSFKNFTDSYGEWEANGGVEQANKAIDFKNLQNNSFNVRGLPGGTFGQSVIDSTLGVAGNIDDFLGGPTGLGDYANNYVTAQEMAMGEKPKADFSWDYLINGLPRDTGNLIGSGIGLAAPIAAATLAAPFVGVGATAAGIGGALAGAGLESMAEGGQKMRDSLANGDSLETAQDKARTVAGENMALLAPTNILGLGALKKVGQGLKTAYNGGKAVSATGGALANYPKLSQAADFAKGAGWAGLGAMNEGAQEAWQQGIQDSVEPNTDWGILPWNWNDEQAETFNSTIGPTMLMAGAGGGARLAARKLGMSDVPQVDTAPQVNNNLFGAGTAEISTQGADIDEQVAHLKDGYQSVIPQVAGVLVNDFGIEGAQISSGFRTREHNREVGGAENSHHVGDGEHGDALDIVLPDGVSAETAEAIKQRFENSGVFDEVLFHDAGSGYHLHLGGLKTDNIGNSYGSYSGNADVDSAINEMAEKYNLDPALLAAMAEQESGFNQSAQSEAGAMGIMQLMPSTAEGLGVDPSDLRGNLEGGAKYLRQMLDKYDGDVEKALAAYNAGPGSLDSVNGDISQLSGETQKYVPSVMERYNKFKNKSGGGISSSGNILDWDSTNEDFSKLDFFPKDGEQSQGTVNEFLENLAKLEESDDKATKEKGRQAQDILQQYGDDTEKLTEKAKELGYQQTVNPAEVHGRIPMRRIVSTALNNGQVTFATKKAADIFASSPIGQTMERQGTKGKTFKVTDNFKMNEQVNAISQQVNPQKQPATKTVQNTVKPDVAVPTPLKPEKGTSNNDFAVNLLNALMNIPEAMVSKTGTRINPNAVKRYIQNNDLPAMNKVIGAMYKNVQENGAKNKMQNVYREQATDVLETLLNTPEALTSTNGARIAPDKVREYMQNGNIPLMTQAINAMSQNLREHGIEPQFSTRVPENQLNSQERAPEGAPQLAENNGVTEDNYRARQPEYGNDHTKKEEPANASSEGYDSATATADTPTLTRRTGETSTSSTSTVPQNQDKGNENPNVSNGTDDFSLMKDIASAKDKIANGGQANIFEAETLKRSRINTHSAEAQKENGNSNTELDRLPKVPIAKLRQSEQRIVRFGKAIGVPVHFVESNETTNRGVFTHNGEIFINRKATVPAHSIFVHEFVHWLKASPENAGAYDVLHACLENSSGLFNEARINKYRGKIFDGNKMTDEEIVEEIICDAMTHTESAEKLMRAVNNVDGDLATRVACYLKAMWDKFCKAIGFNPKILSRKQQLPNELSVTELQRADIAFNKILMNTKGNDGKPVFYRKGTDLVLREANAKPVDTYQVNPIGYTYAVAYSKDNSSKISASVRAVLNMIRGAGLKVVTDVDEMKRALGESLNQSYNDSLIQKLIISYEEGDKAPDLTLKKQDYNGKQMYGVAFIGNRPKNYIPKKIGKAYKLMEQWPDGSLHALFAGTDKTYKIGEWNWAQGFTPDEAGGIKSMKLAPRYGWHMGTGVPATHHLMGITGSDGSGSTLNPKIGYPSKGSVGHPAGSKRVWVEVHYDATNDYSDIAASNPGPEKDIRGLVPFGGYYMFQESNLSNWIIASSIKFDHVLTEKERQKILDEAGYDEELVWRTQVVSKMLNKQINPLRALVETGWQCKRAGKATKAEKERAKEILAGPNAPKQLPGWIPVKKSTEADIAKAKKKLAQYEAVWNDNQKKVEEKAGTKDWAYKQLSEEELAEERAKIRRMVYDNPDLKIKDKSLADNEDIQYFQTAQGEVYGFVKDGVIYVDTNNVNANIPVHEFTHVWDKIVQETNPELWEHGKSIMKQLPLWKRIAESAEYADIAHDENLLASEVHARLTGESGERILNLIEKKNHSTQGIINAFKAWAKKYWQAVKDSFTQWSSREANKVTLEDFINMPLSDLAKGTNIGEMVAQKNKDEEPIEGNNNQRDNENEPKESELERKIRERVESSHVPKVLEAIEKRYGKHVSDFVDSVFPDKTALLAMLDEAKEAINAITDSSYNANRYLQDDVLDSLIKSDYAKLQYTAGDVPPYMKRMRGKILGRIIFIEEAFNYGYDTIRGRNDYGAGSLQVSRQVVRERQNPEQRNANQNLQPAARNTNGQNGQGFVSAKKRLDDLTTHGKLKEKWIDELIPKPKESRLKHSIQGAFSIGNKYSRGVDLSPSTDGVAIAARANNNLVANMKGLVKKANAKFNPFHHEELENLRIDKRDKEKDLNLIEYQFVSPTRESKKYKAIQPFVMKGKQAMAKQEKLRFEFNEGMNEVDKLLGWREGFHRNDSKFKERKEALNEILLKGDLEGKEFTNDELIKAGYDAETIKGYRKMRALLDKAWKLANDTKSRIKYQSITSSTQRRAEADFADLKDKNPFAEIISKVHNPDGTVTINYKAPHVRRVAKQTVLPSELENLRKNKDVHIVETTQSLKGTTQVTYYQREAGMGKLKGYIPHVFHGWYVCKVDKDGKAIVDEDGNVAMDNIVTTANSLSEAAKLGRELAKENPNANYRVVPQTFSAPGAQEQAIVMGDFDYAKIVGKVADSMSMSITDAQAMLDNTVKMKNRGRFYGYAKQRKGFKGFEQNVYLATMKYFNQTARYAAMDSFKRDSISMYNRIFGAFDDENVTKRSAMAKWTKQYIYDVNGTPTWLEKMGNRVLHNLGLGEERAGGRPVLWFQQKIMTYPMTILKLGVFNPSSAILNLTQLFNLYGAMGEKVLSPQAYQRLLHKGFADTFKAMSNKDSELGKLLWKDLGLDYQIGMDVASGYSNAEVNNLASLRGFAGRLAGKSMYLFRQSDAFARGVTLLTAYNKALDEGKSKAEAIEYAKEINDKVNFDYSVADEPNIFRALGPISKVLLQFKKYPVKQLELFQDFYLDGRELGLNRKQAALRTLKYMAPYMAMSGMMGIPFISLAGGLLSALVATATGDDDWDWEKKIKQYMITEFGEDSPITQWWLYGAGSFIGLNLGGRVGVGDFLGSDSYNSADGLLGLAVNQTTLGSTIQQVSKQMSYRNYAEALKAINPTMGNIALAYKGEVRTTRGRMKYQYQNMAERMWRAIGFTPLNETLAGDLASNEYAEKQEQTKAKQEAVDDFLANPSSENAARLNELGVTPKTLENESARRTMNRHQLNELAKEKEAAKKKKKPKTYSASDYLKAVQ